MTEPQTQETPAQTQPKDEYDQNTRISSALIVLKNGYFQFGLSKDTRLKLEERRARELASKICQGMAEKILELGGRPRYLVEIELKSLMKAIQDEALKASIITQ